MITDVSKKIENNYRQFFKEKIGKYLDGIQYFFSDKEKSEILKTVKKANSKILYKLYQYIKSIFFYEKTIFLKLQQRFPDLNERYKEFCKMVEKDKVMDSIKSNLKSLMK